MPGKPTGLVVFSNVNLADVEAGRMRNGCSIWVQGDSIVDIRPMDSEREREAAAVVECGGRTAVPGLWDLHTHPAWDWEAPPGTSGEAEATMALRALAKARQWLACGVTAIRVVATPGAVDIALRDSIARGEHTGPRVFAAGEGLSSTGGHGSYGANEGNGPEEFRRLARAQLARGADFIKLMATGGVGGSFERLTDPQLRPEEIRAAVEVAHDAGKKVTVHGGGAIGIQRALNEGVDGVEHGYEFDAETARMMADAGVLYVPTLVVSADIAYWLDLGPVPPWALAKLQQARATHRRCLELAMEAGVTIGVGTDLPTVMMGGVCSTVREMEIMVEIGMHPVDAVRAATINAARWFGRDGELGLLSPGRKADMVLVDGDPFRDVSVLRSPWIVVLDGRIVSGREEADVVGGADGTSSGTFYGGSG